MKKTAIITGGVRRLGGEISRYLLEQNYNVISLNSREYKESDSELFNHPDFSSHKIDLTKNIQTEIIKIIIDSDEIKNLTILVNNASLFFETPFSELKESELDLFFTLHIKLPLFLSQSVHELMLKSDSVKCDIINIADTGGDLLWNKYFAYSLTKHSILHLTKLLAKELGPKIRVNSISPGTIIPENAATFEQIEFYKKQSILKKIGDANEIIRLIDFILHSNFTTGSNFTVDGGRALI